jgi:5-formyltetrahydrofolate cyclo-ligase
VTEVAPLDPRGAKAALRTRLLDRRRAGSPEARRVAGAAITRNVLILAESRAARTITSYVSFGTEPPTLEANDALRERGVDVLVPRVLADLDLDWCRWAGASALVSGLRGPRGLLEPPGEALGVAAVARADLVLVPALAVGRDGTRLGRGGGSYDRALARVPAATPVAALLYEDELLETVPAEPHDRRVSAAVLPSGVVALG